MYGEKMHYASINIKAMKLTLRLYPLTKKENQKSLIPWSLNRKRKNNYSMVR